MKNKGFVLMETIVVIVVISVALLTLFSSYNKILSKVKSENRYDNPEHVYMTYFIKEKLSSASVSVFDLSKDYNSSSNQLTDYTNHSTISSAISVFNVKKIHLIKGIGSSKMIDNLKYFDAYIIDYLKKLDVTENDELIIVEYNKIDRDENYSPKKMYNSNGSTPDLKKTYIASLKW